MFFFLFIAVRSQIILSTILAIQNNNHTQEHKIYLKNPFSLKGKTTGQIPNNFTIIKSITIIFLYVSYLKKKSLLFSLLSHTLIIFLKCDNTLLSHFYFSSPCTALSLGCLLFLSDFLLAALSIHLCVPLFSTTRMPSI